MENGRMPHWRVSPASVVLNAAAAALLAPVVIAATFFLAVDSVLDGRLFRVLKLIVSVLPADAETGSVVLVALALGSLGLLALACARVAWLFPLLLLVLGGLAETYILADTRLSDLGDAWVLAPGLAGILLGALQVRRVARG